jgi:hypothetical protein
MIGCASVPPTGADSWKMLRGFGAADWNTPLVEVQKLAGNGVTRISTWRELRVGNALLPVRYDYEFKANRLNAGSIRPDRRDGRSPTLYEARLLFEHLKNRHGDPDGFSSPLQLGLITLRTNFSRPDLDWLLHHPNSVCEWDWRGGPSLTMQRTLDGRIRCFAHYPLGSND